MTRENFLLLSLNEEKAKKVAQVITNVTCRKILERLADKDATESELAKELNLPISTIHYNLQQLMESNLITAEEFHYSEKGKEVNHYKLANKYVIIAPKSTFGIKEKLRSILPAIGLTVVAAGFLQLFSNYMISKQGQFAREESSLIMAAKPAMEKAAADVAEEAVAKISSSAQSAAAASSPFLSIALWFLIGAFFSVIIYLLIEYFRRRKE